MNTVNNRTDAVRENQLPPQKTDPLIWYVPQNGGAPVYGNIPDPRALLYSDPSFVAKLLLNQQRNEFEREARAETYMYKKELEKQKQEHAEKMQEIREDSKFARDNASFGIGVDAEEYLLAESKIELDDGRIKIKRRKLSNYKGLRMKKIQGVDDPVVRYFVISGDFPFTVVVENNGDVPKRIHTRLLRAGVIKDVSRSERSVVASALFDYLLRHSETVELPLRFGWFKRGATWEFCDETMTSVIDLLSGGDYT